MSEPAHREWRFTLDAMISFAGKVITYTEGLEQSGCVASEINHDATVRNQRLPGEAATNIPETIRQENPQILWRLDIATRNRLIHGHLGIDNDTPWGIIRSDVPAWVPLRVALKGPWK